MDDKEINLLLIDNDAARAGLIKDALAGVRGMTANIDVVDGIEKGLEKIAHSAVNAVMIEFETFGDKLAAAYERMRTAAPGIPVLVVLGRADEEKLKTYSGELPEDYIFKEELNGYVLMKTVRSAMDRNVLMLELEQYTKEFMASEERFRNIIANNTDAMVIVDMKGLVLFMNFAAEELFGKQSHGMIGRQFDYPLTAGKTTEFSIRRENAPDAVAEMRVVRTEWEGEKAYLASLRDETERKRAEEENTKLQKQLIQGEKLMSVGMLASGVAHEINNPLTIILGFTQILLRHVKADDPNHSHLKDIEAASLRCKKIVSQLLLFAHQESISFDSIMINDIIDNSLDLVAFQLETGNIRIEKKYQEDLPPVFGNLQQLEQVFINLLTNAKDAMPGGGTIEISTRALAAPVTDSKDTQSGKLIEIVFSDTGPGIAQDVIGSIFDPFFTTKAVGKGTGLGLSVCQGIIDKHRGKIKAESAPGKGATFRIQLPVRADIA